METKRAEQTKQERRRRNTDSLSGKRRRLTVDESLLDRDKYEYRWINDDPVRVQQLTVDDDWELVSDRDQKLKKDGAGTGSEVAVQAGGASGPQRQVLVRKPKQYYDEDYAAQQRQIDAMESDLQRGAVPGGDLSNTYVPDRKDKPVTISRG